MNPATLTDLLVHSLYVLDAAEQAYDLKAGFEEVLYQVIGAHGFGDDTLDADLYAQLADSLTPTTPREDARLYIEAAIERTRRFYSGY